MNSPVCLFKAGVYRIVNRANGAMYVGSSRNLRKRWWAHQKDLETGAHHAAPLQRAWLKYGRASFEFEVLLHCSPDHVLFYEQRALDILAPRYNVCRTAGNCAGVKVSEANKIAQSLRHKGKVTPPEVRKKMSEAAKGRAKSPEHLAALRQAWAENPSPLLGRKLSEETKSRISKGHIGKVLSEEQKAKIGAASRARATISEDTVRFIRQEVRKGVKKSELSRALSIGICSVSDIVAGRSYAYVLD